MEKLFYITASYCIQNKIPIDETCWYFDEEWDRDTLMKDISMMGRVAWLYQKYIHLKAKNHYKILCLVFGFATHTFEEQKRMLEKDRGWFCYSSPYESFYYANMFLAGLIAFTLLKSSFLFYSSAPYEHFYYAAIFFVGLVVLVLLQSIVLLL